MKNIVLAALSFLCCLSITMTAAAHEHVKHQPMQTQCQKCYHKLSDKLQLTDAQKKQIKEIRSQYKSQMTGQRKLMKAIRANLHEIIKSDKLDQQKIDTLIKQQQEIVATKTRMNIMMKHQIYMSLTAEQKKKLDDMMKNWNNKNKCMCKKMTGKKEPVKNN